MDAIIYLCQVIAGAALALAIVLSIGNKVKARKAARKTPSPPPRDEESVAHKPRYAAGGDMDRINRSAYMVELENKRSDAPAIIGSIIIGLLILVTAPKIISAFHQQMTSPSGSITASAPTPSTPIGTIELEMVSADFSGDLSKVFVTYRYINNSAQDAHSLVPTINLLDAEGNTVQTMTADMIDQIASGETKEIISAVEIEPANLGKISHITVHTSYNN